MARAPTDRAVILRTPKPARGAAGLDKPDFSLINCNSASLTIVLDKSRNRAQNFSNFVRISNARGAARRAKSRLRSADLSGTLTAERPGKSDASERRPADKRENFPRFPSGRRICPISPHYRTFYSSRQARRIWRRTMMTKRRLGLC